MTTNCRKKDRKELNYCVASGTEAAALTLVTPLLSRAHQTNLGRDQWHRNTSRKEEERIMSRLPKALVTLFALMLFCALVFPALAGGDIKGQVTSVNPEKLEFTAKTDVMKPAITFQLDEDPAIYINDRVATFEEVQPGDRVTIIHRQEGENWIATVINVDRK